MQRLARIHCRGALSSQIRPLRPITEPLIFFALSSRLALSRFVQYLRFACRNHAVGPRSSFSFRHIPRARNLLLISASLTLPLAVERPDVQAANREESTLEQSLLDTSEEERHAETYGVSKDWSVFYHFFRRIKIAFLRYMYEPIATGLRFIQLVVIFVPVFATIPVIFIGSRDTEHDNERSGTLWWYSFLVRQMERAGPTFIKARLINYNC